MTCNFGSNFRLVYKSPNLNFTMPPVLSKLTSFFPPVITDREKVNDASYLARINMRSDERVEDSIERRLACLSAELKPNITGWIQDGIASIRTPEMKLSIKKAFFTDGRFEEIRSRALSQKKADAQQQELWEELMLYEEPETIEEISSGGDLLIATFEEPDSDLDNLI